jgi:predicted DNA-binding antitoxin AbrB/MazE fold protein
MSQIVDAVYDGAVLRPESALPLAPNTRVRLTVEIISTEIAESSFLAVARSLKLSGPPDWSENLDRYLYGNGDPTE